MLLKSALEMNLALSSDFPSTANPELVARIRAVGRSPRIAWLAPAGQAGRLHYSLAKITFLAHGFTQLERVPVGVDQNDTCVGVLDGYDVVYLSGGDPLAFRHNLQRSGFDVALREFAASGRLIIGASGGAMQLTKNVSLYRLLSGPVDEVVAEHGRFDALGLVGYEILPHLNRHKPMFQERVQRYSERVPHDIVALADGAVAFSDDHADCHCFGQGERYRRGVRVAIGTAA